MTRSIVLLLLASLLLIQTVHVISKEVEGSNNIAAVEEQARVDEQDATTSCGCRVCPCVASTCGCFSCPCVAVRTDNAPITFTKAPLSNNNGNSQQQQLSTAAFNAAGPVAQQQQLSSPLAQREAVFEKQQEQISEQEAKRDESLANREAQRDRQENRRKNERANKIETDSRRSSRRRQEKSKKQHRMALMKQRHEHQIKEINAKNPKDASEQDHKYRLSVEGHQKQLERQEDLRRGQEEQRKSQEQVRKEGERERKSTHRRSAEENLKQEPTKEAARKREDFKEENSKHRQELSREQETKNRDNRQWQEKFTKEDQGKRQEREKGTKQAQEQTTKENTVKQQKGSSNLAALEARLQAQATQEKTAKDDMLQKLRQQQQSEANEKEATRKNLQQVSVSESQKKREQGTKESATKKERTSKQNSADEAERKKQEALKRQQDQQKAAEEEEKRNLSNQQSNMTQEQKDEKARQERAHKREATRKRQDEEKKKNEERDMKAAQRAQNEGGEAGLKKERVHKDKEERIERDNKERERKALELTKSQGEAGAKEEQRNKMKKEAQTKKIDEENNKAADQAAKLGEAAVKTERSEKKRNEEESKQEENRKSRRETNHKRAQEASKKGESAVKSEQQNKKNSEAKEKSGKEAAQKAAERASKQGEDAVKQEEKTKAEESRAKAQQWQAKEIQIKTEINTKQEQRVKEKRAQEAKEESDTKKAKEAATKASERAEKLKKETDAKQVQEREVKDKLKAEAQAKAEQAQKIAEAPERNRKAEEAVKQRETTTYRSDTFRPRPGQVIANSAQVPFRGVYTYMFWVRPEGIQGGWSNLIHKGQSDGQRNPAVWFYPGSTRLHIRSGTRNDWNNGLDPQRDLPMWAWTHVAFTHTNSEIIVYYNGAEVGRQKIQEPLPNSGPLYAASPWVPSGIASLSEVMYAPHALPQSMILARVEAKNYARDAPKETLLSARYIPKQHTVLAQNSAIQANRQFSYAFWVRPRSIYPHWAGIFHKGSADGNRNPALWFYPGQTRLHIRSGTQGNWNDGIDPPQQLALNEWTHVVFAHRHGYFRVWYNGNLVADNSVAMPVENEGPIWGCAPWQAPADAVVGDLRHVNIAIDNDYARRLFQANRKPSPQIVQVFNGRRRPVRHSLIMHDGQIPRSVAWTWMFWIKPDSIRHHWTNILHKGHHDMQRAPAIWACPGSTRLHIRSSTPSNWNNGLDSDQVPMHHWTHIAITHRGGEMRVFFNGQVRHVIGIEIPAPNDGPFWFSNPWYDSAPCEVADIRYSDDNLTQDVVQGIVSERRI